MADVRSGSATGPNATDAHLRGLLRVGAWAAFASVALIVIQILVYLRWPPPADAAAAYALFADDPLAGLLSLDLLYIVNNTGVLLLYLALFVGLRRTRPGAATIGLALGALGMAAYMASTVGFEMMHLAEAYASSDGAARVALLAAGEAVLAGFDGTAFTVYYVLSAIALLLFAGSMWRAADFGRAIGGWGLAAGILMVVPSTAGDLGRTFALASLVPWVVFCVLVGRALLRLSARTTARP